MGLQMSLLVAAGGFGPNRVFANKQRNKHVDVPVSQRTEDDLDDTGEPEEDNIQLVLSKVVCDRSKAINALLSHGNDVGQAVLFLQSFDQVISKIGICIFFVRLCL